MKNARAHWGYSTGFVILCAALSACQAVPAAGPSTSQISNAAGKSATEQNRRNAAVFDIVNIDAAAAALVSDFQSGTLKRRFGYGSGGDRVSIGVGDELRVTIFEAGADGLFSTTDTKQTALQIVVQPDGNAAIPYVGSVRFVGRTLEQVRQSILAALRGKAVEPDVIVSTVGTTSRAVTVSGAVRAGGQIALGLKGDHVTEAIAKAGGPTSQPYETYVTLTRGKKVARVLYKTILDHPTENVYVYPGDQIYVTLDPRTFTVLGETVTNGRIPFGADDLNLLEAVALAGGGKDDKVSANGYFVFRYEEKEIVERLVGEQRFNDLLRKGMRSDQEGRYPIVYRIDMQRADSLIVGQTFQIKNRDVLYASRHPSVDLSKFIGIVSGPVSILGTVVSYSVVASSID